MLLSREAEYAIQALLKLATYPKDDYVSILTLSKELSIPFFYLSKILQKLVKQRILRSHKGPKGGVSFAVNPGKTSVFDIIKTIDGDRLSDRCVLGLHVCDSINPCPLHEQWSLLRDQVKSMFEDETLNELSHDPEVMRRTSMLADPTYKPG